MKKKSTFLNWSSGKDSALALYYLQKNQEYKVEHLLTTINAHFDRVTMHGLRRKLLDNQIAAINIPSSTVELPEQPGMSEYEEKMEVELQKLKKQGLTYAAFGDIFLEDLKMYRENQFKKIGLETTFPLWQKDTTKLIHEFIDLDFKAIVVASSGDLGQEFVGTIIDRDFISALPSDIDPCGENGEFHTFCYDGPIFDYQIEFEIGEKAYKEYRAPSENQDKKSGESLGFWFCDLLPK